MQEIRRYRCSVTPEIVTGFRLPCFVRFYFTVRNELELKLVRSVTIRAINSVCSAEVTACAGLEYETIAEMQNVLTGYAGKIYDIAQKVAEDFILDSYYRASMHSYLIKRNTMCCENGEIVDG